MDGNYYVMSRASGHYSPGQWGTIIASEVKANDADIIVAETNQGGDMVEHVIRQYDQRTRINKIHAVKAKEVRAEPIVSLYEQGKVFHYGNLSKLETQQLTWIPGSGKSPNDIDALVYSLMELSQQPQYKPAKWNF